jgi:hypothetical protein
MASQADLAIELCEDVGRPVPAALEDADRLTPYGARLRYGRPDPGTADRRSAQRWAAAAIEWAAVQVDGQEQHGL